MFDRQDLLHAGEIVRRASTEELVSRFRHVEASRKQDGSLITEADLAMQARLVRELRVEWPQVPLLGEEMGRSEQQALLAGADHGIWILDPLDGTSNFASGIPFFGVSLALRDAEGVLAGIVHDPIRDECFSALRGVGAWLNAEPLTVPEAPTELGDCMAMVDFKRLPEALVQVLARGAPYRSQRSFGSVALDWCWIAAGRCQVYLHGGQKLWDFAAGSLILAESGAAGGLLADYRGDWQRPADLVPRIALAAGDARLLQCWRDWLVAALDAAET